MSINVDKVLLDITHVIKYNPKIIKQNLTILRSSIMESLIAKMRDIYIYKYVYDNSEIHPEILIL